ncbi:tRNA (adenosine(37)-N6)-threonylcarbamoyltransferase complex ATPase subunit type 1 TsaE [bacterium]|nr:tRNA (adenosine(37)-N6)-threonylcarbamoyltransferase complex ATPase subunit type 1 TsaE [bacterium]
MNEKEILKFFSRKEKREFKGMVYGLIGDLGAGKTYLVKQILGLFSNEFVNQVHSPSFNLCNIYEIMDLTVHHFDLYRIESDDELINIGIWDSLENTSNLIFIEWVDMFPKLAAKCDRIIKIEVCEDRRVYKMIDWNQI